MDQAPRALFRETCVMLNNDVNCTHMQLSVYRISSSALQMCHGQDTATWKRMDTTITAGRATSEEHRGFPAQNSKSALIRT